MRSITVEQTKTDAKFNPNINVEDKNKGQILLDQNLGMTDMILQKINQNRKQFATKTNPKHKSYDNHNNLRLSKFIGPNNENKAKYRDFKN